VRWNSESSYDIYWDEAEYNHGFTRWIGQLQLVLADRQNWLKVEDTHLDSALVETTLVEMPELLTKVINHNLHLSRTIDRNKAEAEAEEEHLHQQIKASDRIIEELRQELDGYKTLEKLTEDSSDETIISN
jgi:hypothetical protein